MYIPKYIYIFKCERLKDHQKINLILAWKCSKAAPAKQHENKGRKIGVKDSCAQWCNLWNTEMLLMIIFALYFDNISTIYWNRFYFNSSHSLSHSWIYKKKKHINYAQYNICNDFQLIFPFSKFGFLNLKMRISVSGTFHLKMIANWFAYGYICVFLNLLLVNINSIRFTNFKSNFSIMTHCVNKNLKSQFP